MTQTQPNQSVKNAAVLSQMEAGKTPPKAGAARARTSRAPGQRSPRLSGAHDLSFSTCVRTLSGMTISRRGLLHLEMAVGLAVFLDAGVANKTSKNMLQEIYARAGYDCASSDGADYKTVNRRIQASAALFGKLGLEVLNHWATGQKETKLLQAISLELTKVCNFNSMDDVLDFVGRTSNRAVEKGGTKSAWDIEVGSGEGVKHIRLPKTLTEAELVELASKIMALAEEAHVREAAAAGAGESAGATGERPGGAPERRVASKSVEVERRVLH